MKTKSSLSNDPRELLDKRQEEKNSLKKEPNGQWRLAIDSYTIEKSKNEKASNRLYSSCPWLNYDFNEKSWAGSFLIKSPSP